jgi:hypothetical protein
MHQVGSFEETLTFRAKPAFFTLEIVKGQGVVHDTFRRHAMIQAEEVPYLMGTLLYCPVNKVILVTVSPIELIGQPCCGHDCCPCRRTGQAEQ